MTYADEPNWHETEQPDDGPVVRRRVVLILTAGFLIAAGMGLWLIQ